MRNVINISLPDAMVKTIKKEVRQGKYASTSEFVRHLVRLWNTKQLAGELHGDMREFEAGKGRAIASLDELD